MNCKPASLRDCCQQISWARPAAVRLREEDSISVFDLSYKIREEAEFQEVTVVVVVVFIY